MGGGRAGGPGRCGREGRGALDWEGDWEVCEEEDGGGGVPDGPRKPPKGRGPAGEGEDGGKLLGSGLRACKVRGLF